MTKEEIVLQITLKLLDNFKYDSESYGGTSKDKQASLCAGIAANMFNTLYESIKL